MKVLVTGGAGLIGSHIVDDCVKKGHQVVIIDNLSNPTHLNGKPDHINASAEFLLGDIRDGGILKRALKGVEAVSHQAALTYFTTDNYADILDNNTMGTVRLLETIRDMNRSGESRVSKIVTASSVSSYGDGKYECLEHGVFYPSARPESQLKSGIWEPLCPVCGRNSSFLPIDEGTKIDPPNSYGVSKYDQERLTHIFGREHGIASVALRYFLTYGPRQSITNPYTGICSLFSTRILNDLPIVIYEDGRQQRDFTYVEDVAEANMLALEKDEANGESFNVGTGKGVSVEEFALTLYKIYKKGPKIQKHSTYRLGDVRHLVANVNKISTKLGYRPVVSLSDGLQKYIDWIALRGDVKDYFSQAFEGLKGHQIVRSAN